MRRTQALSTEMFTAINGTYGPDCHDRTGSWSARIAGADSLPHPELSVVQDDSACSLTLTSVTGGQTLTATPALSMAVAYEESASAFGPGGPVWFFGNARLDSATFSAPFLVTLLVSAPPGATNGSVTARMQRLGAASTFALVAGTTITSTGPTAVTGDVGVSGPGAVTGFPPATITAGTVHPGDLAAVEAQNDVLDAYKDIVDLPCMTPLTGQDLGGLTLSPGVHCFASSAALTGTLTLDAQDHPNAVFIFQIGSTLTTAADASVVMANAGLARNVFWQIGSSATVGANSVLVGNLLASADITFGTGASLLGRALASGAVTLDFNTIQLSP